MSQFKQISDRTAQLFKRQVDDIIVDILRDKRLKNALCENMSLIKQVALVLAKQYPDVKAEDAYRALETWIKRATTKGISKIDIPVLLHVGLANLREIIAKEHIIEELILANRNLFTARGELVFPEKLLEAKVSSLRLREEAMELIRNYDQFELNCLAFEWLKRGNIDALLWILNGVVEKTDVWNAEKHDFDQKNKQVWQVAGDVVDSEGWSLLHRAVEMNNLKAVDSIAGLTSVRVDLHSRNKPGISSIMQAIKLGYFDTALILFNHGAQLSVSDRIGRTLIVEVFASGNSELIKALAASHISHAPRTDLIGRSPDQIQIDFMNSVMDALVFRGRLNQSSIKTSTSLLTKGLRDLIEEVDAYNELAPLQVEILWMAINFILKQIINASRPSITHDELFPEFEDYRKPLLSDIFMESGGRYILKPMASSGHRIDHFLGWPMSTVNVAKDVDLRPFLKDVNMGKKYRYKPESGELVVDGTATIEELAQLKEYFHSTTDHQTLNKLMERSNKLFKLSEKLQKLYMGYKNSLPEAVSIPVTLLSDIYDKWIFAVQRSYPEEGVAELVFAVGRFLHLLYTGQPVEEYLRAGRQEKTEVDGFMSKVRQGIEAAIQLYPQSDLDPETP